MSETFNPHEILSRIRSKSGQLISTTTPTPTQNVQPSNHVNPPPSNASPTKTVKSTSPMPATGLKSMKSSPTLLLTPSQVGNFFFFFSFTLIIFFFFLASR